MTSHRASTSRASTNRASINRALTNRASTDRASTNRASTRGAGRAPDRSRRADLEGVRAIAVLGVVIYHLRTSWLPGGFAGVDVFFVLSGFFITSLLLREADRSSTIDLLAFWGRRARRLLPAAAVVMIATVLASLVFVNSIDAHRFATDGLFAAVFSVNWRYAALGTSYLADPDPSPLVHYWSLGVEEQFYLIWPVVLFGLVVVVGRRWPRRLPASIGGVALVASVASFLIAWHQTIGQQPYAYFATYARVWQLGLGALLAVSAVRLGRLPLAARTLARWAGVGAVIGFFLVAPLDIVYPGWIAIVPTFGVALIVVAGLPGKDGARTALTGDPVLGALRSRVSQLLGRYSYGWYLWHWPPLVLLPLVVHHPLRTWELVSCALIALAAAAVSYHVLEHPIRVSSALSARHGRLSLAMGAAIILVGVGTAQLVATAATQRTNNATVTTAAHKKLVPSPGIAAAEQNTAGACEMAQTAEGDAPECRLLPNTGTGDVILIGDSHAAQWLPAIKPIASSRQWGLRVWTRANCSFADVTRVVAGAPNRACDDWRTNAIQRLIAAKPSLAVIASYPPPGGSSVYDQQTKSAVTGKAAIDVYVAGLTVELARLRAAHIPTLVIDDEPRFDKPAPKCVLENADHLASCSQTRASSLHSTPDSNGARAVPGVRNLNFDDVFCSATRCDQVVGSTLAYRDNNHLTHEMVKSLAPRVAAAMVHTIVV